LLGRKNDLYIYAHANMADILLFFKKHFAEGLQFNIHLKNLNHRSLNLIHEDKIVEVFSFPLKHRVPSFGFLFQEKQRQPNIKKEVIERFNISIKDIQKIKNGEDFHPEDGKRIENKDLVHPAPKPRKYAFCSDTSYYERIIPWIKQVDLLYHEATFADAELKIARQTGHSTASQAAMIAQKAEVKMLLLGHFSNRYKEPETLLNEARSVFSNTYLAEDLEVYRILQNVGNYEY
jgi:ribonuclease Z